VPPTYELVVVSKPSIGFPEALLLTDRRQIAQGLVAPVVQLGYAGSRSPLHSAGLRISRMCPNSRTDRLGEGTG